MERFGSEIGFTFRVKPRFPRALTREFLLVDLANNLDQLVEAKDEVLKRLVDQVAASDTPKLRRAVREYGNERTKKLFVEVLKSAEQSRDLDWSSAANTAI